MKKVLMVVAALALMAGAANAGPIPYIGLYIDADHSVCEVYNPGGFFPFTLWTWVNPSDLGAMCAEYKVVAPINVIVSTATTNPGASVDMGSPIGAPGASICFATCQTSWFWTYQVMIYSTDTVASFFDVLAHDDAGGPQTANCEPGYPLEQAIVINNLGVNQPCEEATANDNATWGAIKSMINE